MSAIYRTVVSIYEGISGSQSEFWGGLALIGSLVTLPMYAKLVAADSGAEQAMRSVGIFILLFGLLVILGLDSPSITVEFFSALLGIFVVYPITMGWFVIGTLHLLWHAFGDLIPKGSSK